MAGLRLKLHVMGLYPTVVAGVYVMDLHILCLRPADASKLGLPSEEV